MKKTWHTSAAVAAVKTGAPIVPFFVKGLPYHWGPLDMLKVIPAALIGGEAFEFKIRLGPPIPAERVEEERNYTEITERVRQAVRILAD